MTEQRSPRGFIANLTARARLSPYGERVASSAGIAGIVARIAQERARRPGAQLIDLNAGNPRIFPELSAVWREAAAAVIDRELGTSAAVYGDIGGHPEFVAAFGEELAGAGHQPRPGEILVTSGAQACVSLALHVFIGPDSDGRGKKVLLPQCPEYEAYQTMGLPAESFRRVPPRPVVTGEHCFRYALDWTAIELADIGLVLLSRPCNPSGAVVPAAALRDLARRADAAGIPVVVDSVYAAPIPALVHCADFELVWGPNIVNVFSLSKAGLAGERVGIAVGPAELLRPLRLAQAHTFIMAAKLGQALAASAIRSGALASICRSTLRTHYRRTWTMIHDLCREAFGATRFYLHELDGGIFAWLWLPDLPITDVELCERLGARGVFVTPGSLFFGADDGASPGHSRGCVRISLTADESLYPRAFAAIAEIHRLAEHHGERS